jgi:hypothetical protein
VDVVAAYNEKQPGSPEKGCAVMIDVVRGEGVAQGRTFPTVLQLGPDCFDEVKKICEGTVARMEEWKDVIRSTNIE